MKGLILRRLKRKEAEEKEAEEKKKGGARTHYYTPVWEEAPLTAGGEEMDALVVIDEEGRLTSQLYERLGGVRVIRIREGESYRDLGGDTYETGRGRADYGELLDNLLERGIEPRWIVWSRMEGNWIDGGLAEQMEGGIYALLYLTQALMDKKVSGVRLVYMYGGIETNPVAEGLSGFMKSLRQERSGYEYSLVEVRGEAAMRGACEAAVGELRNGNRSEVEIRYEGGARMVRRIRELSGDGGSGAVSYVREGGIYLITGGGGRLGLAFAERMGKKGKARIILMGRSALNAEQEARLEGIRRQGSEVEYVRCDITKREEAEEAVGRIKVEYGRIDGVIHAAGAIRDSLIGKKTREEMDAVLGPKVYGMVNVDRATKGEALDFFVLFSSVAGVTGNAGQGDYAYGNAFMDAYARLREEMRAAGERSGRTLSINWPLWESGGMRVDDETKAWLEKKIGMVALETEEGLAVFERLIGSREVQIMITRTRGAHDGPGARTTARETRDGGEPVRKIIKQAGNGQNELMLQFEKDIRKYISEQLKVREEDIDENEELSAYGFDSIGLKRFSSRLEDEYGFDLTPAVFFEFPTVRRFVVHLMSEQPETIGRYYRKHEPAREAESGSVEESAQRTQGISLKKRPRFVTRREEKAPRADSANVKIAIVGMSGVFPQSANLEEFWRNLESGKDCISEIPPDRWDWRPLCDAMKQETARWGGFIDNVDKFDPLFFGISPLEAEAMDPQQRLILELVWTALEDGGYRLRDISERKIGLFIGVSSMDYAEIVRGNMRGLEGFTSTGLVHSMLANRVSYWLNINGPSEPIDTACSSSLVALHRGVQSIAHDGCEMAIVGGVNLILTPSLHIAFSAAGMLSPQGRCKTFDAAADGYVRGEGAGVVVLKPLVKAEADGDRIYAVIRGSSEYHGGRANSLTAPNTGVQARLLVEAYERAGVEPWTISYIETHGTGTSLGDPAEVNGIKRAFEELYARCQREVPEEAHCGIGSVKSNIGHLEAASGMAGVLKVVLAMRRKTLPASIHCTEVNPYIKLHKTPLYIVTATKPWDRLRDDMGAEIARRAGVSSFGFGGAYAHVVIEEYEGGEKSIETLPAPYVAVLSAKDEGRLNEYAAKMASYFEKNVLMSRTGAPLLSDIAYTLQTGREAMEERLALVADSAEELLNLLKEYLDDGPKAGKVFRGNVKTMKEMAGVLIEGESGREFMQRMLENKELSKVAQLWALGVEIDWERLYHGLEKPKRISLPTYPFANKRYWIQTFDGKDRLSRVGPQSADSEIFRDTIKMHGNEFYLSDHVIYGIKTVPGAVLLEMARSSGERALKKKVRKIRDVIWARAVNVLDKPLEVAIGVFSKNSTIEYQITPLEKGSPEGPFSVGKLEFANEGEIFDDEYLNIADIKQRCSNRLNGAECYALFERLGLNYGKSFQSVIETAYNSQESLSKLILPKIQGLHMKYFVLNPSLVDGAFQTAISLVPALASPEMGGSFLPFAIDELEIMGDLTDNCYAYVVAEKNNLKSSSIMKFNISIIDGTGRILVKIRNYSIKSLSNLGNDSIETKKYIRTVYYNYVWEKAELFKMANEGKRPNCILLFDLDRRIFESLEEGFNLENPENQLVLVEPGLQFQKQGDRHYTIDPGSEDDYQELIDAISFTESARIIVIHRWSGKSSPNPLERITDQLTVGIYSVFYLSKAIIGRKLNKEVTLLYVYAVEPGNSAPPYASLSAFARTIYRENLKFMYKIIEIRAPLAGQSDIDILRLARIVMDEAESKTDGEFEVCYKENARHVRRLVKLADNNMKGNLPVREKGVYLITGGAGALGLVIAGYLSKKYQAKIILAGRSDLDQKKIIEIKSKASLGSEADYIQADVSRREDVEKLISEIRSKYKTINGVIHCAGVTRDSFVLKKRKEDIGSVLAPKVLGAINLDEATKKDDLDFMIFFSSLSAVFGNIGQSDYAFANSFLDHYAEMRESLRSKGERSGKTLSINWPLWLGGGMGRDDETRINLNTMMNTAPLDNDGGIIAFEYALSTPLHQIIVIPEPSQSNTGGAIQTIDEISSASDDTSTLLRQSVQSGASDREKLENFLKNIVGGVIKIEAGQIQSSTSFEHYGINSLIIMKINSEFEKYFANISKTLLFEYTTISELSEYFWQHHRTEIVFLFDRPSEFEKPHSVREINRTIADGANPAPRINQFYNEDSLPAKANKPRDSDIAIIGLSGKYPMADTMAEFWENLKSGRDCISEIPMERWDYRLNYDPDKNHLGKSHSKWGGFISDVDKFDPSFFNISPIEAEFMDPQERLFLETVWHTLEDAGYTRLSLQDSIVGVYAGVMWGEYKLFGDAIKPTTGYWSIPNRVSYYFNFKGPSMAVDTACSSSLTAIHLACESIQRGYCDMAVAGGVNISVHPNKYVVLSLSRFASSDGRCRSFGNGGDGYVPGEGVGAILLKPLARAAADGDNIYAVIKSSSINHGGKTNGYTVPNPNAQSALIAEALRRSGINPRTISYIEAHGTGTPLGDPIEITGISKAFHTYTSDKQFCSIGSVKSNIGHLESAAGIAGVAKVLLQMKHQTLVPTLHSKIINANINFQNSPFYLQHNLAKWQQPVVTIDGVGTKNSRRAGISSFGAGGSYAHVILEEFSRPPAVSREATPFIFVLSARDRDLLTAYAGKFLDFLNASAVADDDGASPDLKSEGAGADGDVSLADIIYTLQIGREPMDARLAIVVKSKAELINALNLYCKGDYRAGDLYVSDDASRGGGSPSSDDDERKKYVNDAIVNSDHSLLAKLWAAGADIEWNSLYPYEKPRRVSLPTYPFMNERYWIGSRNEQSVLSGDGGSAAQSSPIDHCSDVLHSTENTVDLDKSNPDSFKEDNGDNKSESETKHEGFMEEKPALLPNDVREFIIKQLVMFLKLKKKNIRPDIELSSYGMDSISGIRLINEIEKKYKEKLSIESLRNITVDRLADVVISRMNSARAGNTYVGDYSINTTTSGSMGPNASVPPRPDIVTADYSDLFPEPMKIEPSLETDTILLTGATGVLGGRLVKDLLTMTDSQIYCLVRGESTEQAVKRINDMLQVYDPHGRLQSECEKRIVPIIGDIVQSNLGLDIKTYEDLTRSVDLVIHCAARTSLHGLYDDVKAANVDGSKNMIDFCLKTKQKYFVFISTYTVMGDLAYKSGIRFTEKDFFMGQGFKNLGYAQSKFESEKIVRLAHARGLRWIIVRPGNIMGDSEYGYYPFRIAGVPGIFYEIFKTILKHQIAVDSSQYFDISPVDYVSRSIVYLAVIMKRIYSTYHLNNPEYKTIGDIMGIMKDCGYHLRLISVREFKELLNYLKKYNEMITDLIQFNPAVMPHDESSHADASYTARILQQANIVCHPINSELLTIYWDYCYSSGFMSKNGYLNKIINLIKYSYVKKRIKGKNDP
jgi:thioester reductase-like protein